MQELKFYRRGDDAVYNFHQNGEFNRRLKWRREDKNIQLIFLEKLGWRVVDENFNPVAKPADKQVGLESKIPPEGEWISKKNGKSYVYDLVWSEVEV